MKHGNKVRKKPVCVQLTSIAQSKLFTIEQMQLRFSNGVERVFERIRSGPRKAVLIIPLLNEDTILLVREYAAGTDRYELGFPKGICEIGEDSLETANRELMEEVGYGARTLRVLKSLTIAPGYFAASSQLILATDLYEQRLPGDEPEALEVVTWSLQQADLLLKSDEFTDARSVAALYMVRDLVKEKR